MKTKSLEEIIKANSSKLQANFLAIREKPRTFSDDVLKKRRMINSTRYQTNEFLVDSFYKKISRIVPI